MRKLKGWEAISEATCQAMDKNESLYLIGEGVDDPKGVFGTTLAPFQKFPARVFDSPLSENAITGIGIGAALEGHPCVMVHARAEFLLLAMDQVLNHAAKWRYMSGGTLSVPIVIRCVVGRGWGQAAQHSQSFHSLFAYTPGLKVALPSTPYDCKGLLMGAIEDPNPVIFIEHRWLHNKEGDVPEASYSIPLGKAAIAAGGKDLTCAAFSYQVLEALAARDVLLREGIDMEVIDLRTVRPLDKATLLKSVAKTGRLIVTDIGHAAFGACAEVSAVVAEEGFELLKAPVRRIALPDCPTPCSPALEDAYYPNVQDLVNAARQLVKGKSARTASSNVNTDVSFSGPF